MNGVDLELDKTVSMQPKQCMICKKEACIDVVTVAHTLNLCLIHYYTTGAHNQCGLMKLAASKQSKKKNPSSILLDKKRIEEQAACAQDMFAQAFTDLQKEIGEESAFVMRSAANSDDPLAMLLDPTSSTLARKMRQPRALEKYSAIGQSPSKVKSKRSGDDTEGGFIREDYLLTKKMRELQKQNANFEVSVQKEKPFSYGAQKYEGFRKKNGLAVSNMRKLKEFTVTTSKTANVSTKPQNPYQNLQRPRTSLWNQVLTSSQNNTKSSTEAMSNKPKRKWEDLEKEIVRNITSGNKHLSITCSSCGSTDVEINGNVISRNNNMMKGEVWGSKDRAESVVERYKCFSCGQAWNEG